MKVSTKKYSYLNYGAGTDRLGGAKINYLPEGIVMYADAAKSELLVILNEYDIKL